MTFITSILFLYLSEVVQLNLFRKLLVLIGLLIPSLLAGLRSVYIGTDVLNYVYPLFSIAKNSKNYFQYLSMPALNGGIIQTVSSYEYGYTFLTYIVAKLTGSFQFLQVIIEFSILSFIYLGIKRLDMNNISVWMCMLTYYLLFFNNSLNMVRQWMAMSIILFGFKYIKDQKLVKFILTVLCAYLFHSTALLGLFFYFIYWIIKTSNTRSLALDSYSNSTFSVTAISFVLIVVAVCVATLLINKLYTILGVLGLSKYSYYLSGTLALSVNQLITKLPILLILTININEIFKKNLKIFFYLIVVLDLITSQLASLSDYSIRISTYIAMFNIYGYTVLSESSNKTKMVLIRCLVVVYLLAYWYYFYCVKGNDQTIPYMFFADGRL